MKKKVFAYVGSRNIHSNTLKQTEKILKTLEEKYPNAFEIELFTPNNMRIHPSTGCKNCFSKGTCPIESENIDDSKLLKQKLKEADFIIFASPVYSHNVSSDMKAIAERLSYWGHLFLLAGKSAVVLAAADSNGVTFVSDYLEKVFGIMGLNIIDKINVTNLSGLKDEYVNNLTEHIYNYSFGNYDVEVDDRIELSFQHYKRKFQSLPLHLAEPKYWHENNLFNYESLQDYINDKKNLVTLNKD